MGEMDTIARHMDNGSVTPYERQHFVALSQQLREVDDKITIEKANRSRGDYGQVTKRSAEDRQFENYLRTGDATGLRMIPNVMETRADGVGMSTSPMDFGPNPGPAGQYSGYMVAPAFWATLTVAMKAFGGISQDFRPIDSPTGALMPYPVVDPTQVVASLVTSELTQLSISSPYIFGQGMLAAWPYAIGPVLASLQLVNDSAFDVNGFVAARFGEALGRAIAAACVSGSGSAQPEGIITALGAKGAVVSSGGYVQLGAATAIKNFAGTSTELAAEVLSPQTLISMIQGVDPVYYPGCKFYFNATMAWNMRGLVDSNGRPILSLLNGFDSDNLNNADYSSNSAVGKVFGFPVVIDNNLPSLTASTVGGPVFADLSRAMILRTVSGTTTCMRLSERYADFLAIGYLGWARLDARSNDLRAAITVRPAAT